MSLCWNFDKNVFQKQEQSLEEKRIAERKAKIQNVRARTLAVQASFFLKIILIKCNQVRWKEILIQEGYGCE